MPRYPTTLFARTAQFVRDALVSGHQVVRVAQGVIVAVFDQHIGKLDLHPIHVLPNDDDGQCVPDDAFKMGQDVSELGR